MKSFWKSFIVMLMLLGVGCELVLQVDLEKLNDGGLGGSGGSSSTTGSAGGTGSTTSSGDSGVTPPPPPQIGTQIERMGRPAINLAFNHAFDANMTAASMAKDAWNGENNEQNWGTSFASEIENNLGILDSFDAVCGNQLGADLNPADRYATIASILSNDKLWIELGAGSCTRYMAVELTAVGLPLGSDCGGRKLDYDIIDQSYSMFLAGGLSGVSDGIDADADTKGTTFPYLASPH